MEAKVGVISKVVAAKKERVVVGVVMTQLRC
jgi:hypothetical protein